MFLGWTHLIRREFFGHCHSKYHSRTSHFGTTSPLLSQPHSSHTTVHSKHRPTNAGRGQSKYRAPHQDSIMDSHAHFHQTYDDNNNNHHRGDNSKRNTPEPGTKRRKVDGEKGMDTKKRSVSCDVCRARKVKCVKPEGAMRCEGCVTLDQHCTYTHERKKPGPANRLVPYLESIHVMTDDQLCT